MRNLGNEKSDYHSISSDAGVWRLLLNRVWHHLDAADVLLLLNPLRISGETSNHTSDSVLELNVLGGVDERVDTAVGKHRYHAQVVEPVKSKHSNTRDNKIF